MSPEHPQVVAPRRERSCNGMSPVVRAAMSARQPPGRGCDSAPIRCDVAHRALVGASARICSASGLRMRSLKYALNEIVRALPVVRLMES